MTLMRTLGALALLASQVAAQLPGGASYVFNYSNTHGNHMVLQRDTYATVWGFGTQFAIVQVTLTAATETTNNGQSGSRAAKWTSTTIAQPVNITVQGIVDGMGLWRVRLPPQPAGGPYTLTGQSISTGESWNISDVLFGDVFICGGQSNMAYGMGSILNSSYYVQASAARPGIRIYSPQYSAQNQSQYQQVLQYAINWTVADPNWVQGFSAVCYLSAAQVYDATNGSIPFGLMDVSVGGTAIQLWVPPSRTSECLNGYLYWSHWPWSPSCWFNGMVAPLMTGPTEMKLFLWDQGENNVGDAPGFYECAFPLVVETWRQGLNNTAAPFYFVQLPAYIQSNTSLLADFRAIQLRAAARAPNVGYVITTDDGDAYEGCIHNRDKGVVGARMGNMLLHEVYGFNAVQPYYPEYAAAHAVTNGASVSVTVSVSSRGLYQGLTYVPPDPNSNSSICPTSKGVALTSCDWFAVQTADGAWYNATASISGDGASVILSAQVNATSAGLPVVATRNGYADWPVTNVYNSAGLPLATWPPTNVTSSIVA